MERVKLDLKFSFRCEPRDLYLALTKPQYLQNWIAEKVEFDDKTGIYTFHWKSSSESARISENTPNEFVKWEWVGGDHPRTEYVSFRIEAIPDDEFIDLYVEDFCSKSEEKVTRKGWEKQMERLEMVLK